MINADSILDDFQAGSYLYLDLVLATWLLFVSGWLSISKVLVVNFLIPSCLLLVRPVAGTEPVGPSVSVRAGALLPDA